MTVSTNLKPDWVKDNNIFFEDERFIRIIKFFVVHCPCNDVSAKQISLSDYGWSNPWSKPYYLNKQLKEVANKDLLLCVASNYDNMEKELHNAALYPMFPSDLSNERICIYDCKKNQFMSIFYHIRNAFAHGRFDFRILNDEEYYILEDVQPRKNTRELKVSARMILKKSTLIKWIDIIENGEKEYISTNNQ